MFLRHQARIQYLLIKKKKPKSSKGIIKELYYPHSWKFEDDSSFGVSIGYLLASKDNISLINDFTNAIYIDLPTIIHSINLKISTIRSTNSEEEIENKKEIENDKEKIKEKAEVVKKTHLTWSTICPDDGVISIRSKDEYFGVLGNVNNIVEDSSTLIKIVDCYNNLVHNGLEKDKQGCLDAKKQVDKYISDLDESINNCNIAIKSYQDKITKIGNKRSEYVRNDVNNSFIMSKDQFIKNYHYKYWDKEKHNYVNISDEEAESNPNKYEKNKSYSPDLTYDKYLYNTNAYDKKYAKIELDDGDNRDTFGIQISDIKRNEKYRDIFKDLSKEYSDVISITKIFTDAIATVELKAVKGIERCTSELKKVQNHLKEKYNK